MDELAPQEQEIEQPEQDIFLEKNNNTCIKINKVFLQHTFLVLMYHESTNQIHLRKYNTKC